MWAGVPSRGPAHVVVPCGDVIRAEVPWYQANGIGKVEMKLKNVLYSLENLIQ